MPNIFWFNCLAAVGLATAAFTMYKRPDVARLSTFIVFYIFATSLTWLGEFIVLGFFDSYAYKPGLFADPWAENLSAHLILNSTLWPGIAVLVVAYSLGSGWMLLISLAFVLVETLFLKMGLYEHHWWKSYMTACSVFIYLVLARIWFAKMTQIRGRSSRATIFYFICLVIIHAPIPLLLLWQKQYYDVGLADNLIRSSTIFILSYQMVEALFLVFFVCILSKWYWKLVPFLIAFGGQAALAAGNILIFQDNWNLLYTTLLYFIAVAICIFIDNAVLLTVRNPKPD